jgi:hypothetical protein
MARRNSAAGSTAFTSRHHSADIVNGGNGHLRMINPDIDPEPVGLP